MWLAHTAQFAMGAISHAPKRGTAPCRTAQLKAEFHAVFEGLLVRQHCSMLGTLIVMAACWRYQSAGC